MMRRFYLLLLFSVFTAVAHAENIAATPSNYPQLIKSWQSSAYFGPTPEAACAQQVVTGWSFDSIQMDGKYRAACRFLRAEDNLVATVAYANAVMGCHAGDRMVDNGLCATYTCPPGYTLNPDGVSCSGNTCPAGQTWNPVSQRCRCDSGSDVGDDGQCCPQPGEQIPTMQHCYVSDASSTSCTTSAANGCTIRCTDVTFQVPKSSGDQLVIGPFLALGQMCKYTGSYSPEDHGGGPLSDDELRDINKRVNDPGDPATPGSCLGQGMGYVTGSGGTTCVASGQGGDVTNNTSSKTNDGKGNTSETNTQSKTGTDGSTTTTKTTTTQNADGTTTTTTTTTKHNPDGSITETVKTETTDATGNKTETTSNEETTDKGSWCSNHPDDPACRVDDCPEGTDRAACAKLGNPDSLSVPDVPTVERGISSISPVGIASSASCPQGPALPFGLGYMPLDGICDLASGIRPVLIALAWIGAGLIVIGAFRET